MAISNASAGMAHHNLLTASLRTQLEQPLIHELITKAAIEAEKVVTYLVSAPLAVCDDELRPRGREHAVTQAWALLIADDADIGFCFGPGGKKPQLCEEVFGYSHAHTKCKVSPQRVGDFTGRCKKCGHTVCVECTPGRH
jgi:hypothetical protein